MKTVFTSILTLCALPLLAQVTIDQSNFPATAGYTDAFSLGGTAGVVAPSVGASQTWDYSALVETGQVNIVRIDATSDPIFVDALNHLESNRSIQGLLIPSHVYTAVDANGYYEYGRSFSDTTYSITPVSGGVNDSLNFPDGNHVFQFDNGRPEYLGFPATYQSSWTGTRIEPMNFNLTVAAFGLNNTPAQQVRRVTDTREVVGYGTLVIPLPNGDPSAPMEVLLIESTVSSIDSFFLAGSPMPEPLMSAFGLTQGATASSSAFLFFMPDFHSPLLRFGMDGQSIASIGYRPVGATVPTGISSVELENVSIYPNPVAAGTSLTINLGEAGKAVSAIELIDVTGRLVVYQNLQSTNASLDIPASLVSGVYSVILRDSEAAPLKTSRIVVK